MTTSLKGNRKKLQNLIATIVEDGFYEACRTFEKAGLDESDFHNCNASVGIGVFLKTS
jgi:hypothetical protein